MVFVQPAETSDISRSTGCEWRGRRQYFLGWWCFNRWAVAHKICIMWGVTEWVHVWVVSFTEWVNVWVMSFTEWRNVCHSVDEVLQVFGEWKFVCVILWMNFIKCYFEWKLTYPVVLGEWRFVCCHLVSEGLSSFMWVKSYTVYLLLFSCHMTFY